MSASTGRQQSRSRNLSIKSQLSFDRISIPMWDSSDPERAPPPLPMYPNQSGSPTRAGATSSSIAAAHQAMAERAREASSPAPYTTNPMPDRSSPEKSLIRSTAAHRRLQSMQTNSVRDIRAMLDVGSRSEARSPDRSSIMSASTTPSSRGDEYFESRGRPASRDSTTTPTASSFYTPLDTLKHTPTKRPSSRPILGENTPPSATMIALQTINVRDLPEIPLTTSATSANRSQLTLQSFDKISTQISTLTSIATSLQSEMKHLSQRSKDNASDLNKLKDATNNRDEDIRKSLKDLVGSLASIKTAGTANLGFAATASVLPSSDMRPCSTPSPVTKSVSFSKLASPGSMDQSNSSSNPYSADGAAGVTMVSVFAAALMLVAFEIKEKVLEMRLDNTTALPSAQDISQLKGLIHDFRQSHDKLKETYETDCDFTIKSFGQSKQDSAEILSSVHELKDYLADIKVKLSSKTINHDPFLTRDLTTLDDSVHVIEPLANRNTAIAPVVAELVDTVNREFERISGCLVDLQRDRDEKSSSLEAKHEEVRVAMHDNISAKLDQHIDAFTNKFEETRLDTATQAIKQEAMLSSLEDKHEEVRGILHDDISAKLDQLVDDLTSKLDEAKLNTVAQTFEYESAFNSLEAKQDEVRNAIQSQISVKLDQLISDLSNKLDEARLETAEQAAEQEKGLASLEAKQEAVRAALEAKHNEVQAVLEAKQNDALAAIEANNADLKAALEAKHDNVHTSLIAKHDEVQAFLVAKHDDVRDAIQDVISTKLYVHTAALTNKLDEARLEAATQAVEQEKIFTSAQTISDELGVSIDTLGTTVAGMQETFQTISDEMSANTLTVVEKMEVGFSQIHDVETQSAAREDHIKTHDKLHRISMVADGLEANITEYHPKFMVTLEEILALVNQHYSDFKKRADEQEQRDQSASEHSRAFADEIRGSFLSMQSLLPPPPPSMIETASAEKYDDTPIHEKLDKLISNLEFNQALKEYLERLDSQMLAPPMIEISPEKYEDVPIHEKLDKVLLNIEFLHQALQDHLMQVEELCTQQSRMIETVSEKHNDSPVHHKLDKLLSDNELIPVLLQHVDRLEQIQATQPQKVESAPATFDDTPIHEKLDRLLSNLEYGQTSQDQLQKLEKMQMQLTAASAQISDFVLGQTVMITETHESHDKELEEIALLLQRRKDEKSHLEEDISSLQLEKTNLMTTTQYLKSERDSLVHEKSKLGSDVSALQTALEFRKEELHAMDTKADALERRVREMMIDHAGSLLRSRQARQIKARNSSAASHSTIASLPSKHPSGGVLCSNPIAGGLALALKPRSAPRRNVAPPVAGASAAKNLSRRIMSLNQISHNTPTGSQGFLAANCVAQSSGTKRSQSVRATQAARKASWKGVDKTRATSGQVPLSMPIEEDKENAPATKRDDVDCVTIVTSHDFAHCGAERDVDENELEVGNDDEDDSRSIDTVTGTEIIHEGESSMLSERSESCREESLLGNQGYQESSEKISHAAPDNAIRRTSQVTNVDQDEEYEDEGSFLHEVDEDEEDADEEDAKEGEEATEEEDEEEKEKEKEKEKEGQGPAFVYGKKLRLYRGPADTDSGLGCDISTVLGGVIDDGDGVSSGGRDADYFRRAAEDAASSLAGV